MNDTEQVTLVLRKKEYRVRAGLTVAQALKQVGLNPASYLVTRDGEMITEDELLKAGSSVTLVAVISGG